jgi:hypothetical protein
MKFFRKRPKTAPKTLTTTDRPPTSDRRHAPDAKTPMHVSHNADPSIAPASGHVSVALTFFPLPLPFIWDLSRAANKKTE